MLQRKAVFTLLISLVLTGSLFAQQYSSFDKAKLIVNANPTVLEYYISNNADFDSLAIKNNITVKRSLFYFRDINLTYNLLQVSSPFKRLEMVLDPALSTAFNGFDVENLIRVKILENAFPLDELKKVAPKNVPNGLVLQVNQPINDQQVSEVAGVQATSSGANFTTNLLQATAELLIDRGRQELANGFYDRLANKLDSVVALNTMFPNTAELLANRDPFTLPSLGASWKGAFELDLRAMPENLVKFLEIKLPDEKDKLEVLMAFVKMLESIKSGDHLYEAINNMYNDLPASNTFAQPVRLISLISQEMTMSRTLGDNSDGKFGLPHLTSESWAQEGRQFLPAS